MSTSQQAINNAHFKIDSERQRLAEVEKSFAAAQDNMLNNSEELTKALSKITEFNAKEAVTKDVIKKRNKTTGTTSETMEGIITVF